jgi:predicted phosphoribosyltransferase
VGPTRERYERLLRRSGLEVAPRTFNIGKFGSVRPLDGEPVLLIDDTWTTGASAQSAAAALAHAGAGPVAAVVIGRHINREWHENDKRLRAIPRPFDWERCALCASEDL